MSERIARFERRHKSFKQGRRTIVCPDNVIAIGNSDGTPVDIDAHELRESIVEELNKYDDNEDREHEVRIVFDGPVRLHGDASELFASVKVRNVVNCASAGYGLWDYRTFRDERTRSVSFEFDDSIRNVDTSNVTNMHGMFRNSRLGLIDLTPFDTSNVIDMSEMFSGCRDMNDLKMEGVSAKSLENVDKMFDRVTNLWKIESIPEAFGKKLSELDSRKDQDSKFNLCRRLHYANGIRLATKAGTVMDVHVEGKPFVVRQLLCGKRSGHDVKVSWEGDGNRYKAGSTTLSVNKVRELRKRAEQIDERCARYMREIGVDSTKLRVNQSQHIEEFE